MQHDVLMQYPPEELFTRFFPDGSLPVNRSCKCCGSYKEWSDTHPELADVWVEFAAGFTTYKYCAELVHVTNCGSDECHLKHLKHTHRGTFRPSWPTQCRGVVDTNEGVCAVCLYLKTDRGRGNLFRGLGWEPEFDGQRPLRSTLHQKLQRIKGIHGKRQQAASVQKLPKAQTNKCLISQTTQFAVERFKFTIAERDAEIQSLRTELSDSIKLESLPACVHTLIKLCKKGLSKPDEIFLESWLQRAADPHAALHEVLHDLSILLVDNEQAQMYDTLKPYLKLPDRSHARKLRRDDPDSVEYGPGVNDRALELAEVKFQREAVVSQGDGTRIIRMVERLHSLLVGRQYPPRPSHWPGTKGDPVPHKLQDLTAYVSKLRAPPTQLAHEVYTEAFTCITKRSVGMLPYILIPEATKGFNGESALELMMKTAELSYNNDIICVGNVTDSCSCFSCGAGAAMNTPTVEDVADGVRFLGLDVPEYKYWSRHLGTKTIRVGTDQYVVEYFWEWYGDIPHLVRTVRRNLYNPRLELVTYVHPNGTHDWAMLEEITALSNLVGKLASTCEGFRYTGRSLKYISTVEKMRDQKGDASYALVSLETMDCLMRHQAETARPIMLYFVATFYLVEPFINPEFTNPFLIAAFLWTSHLLFERIESYVEDKGLAKDISLMSPAMRRTAATLSHNGCNHILKMFRLVQSGAIEADFQWHQLALRLINTKSLEGMHGAARTKGTDVNFTFAQWCRFAAKLARKQNKLNKLAAKGFIRGAPKNSKLDA